MSASLSIGEVVGRLPTRAAGLGVLGWCLALCLSGVPAIAAPAGGDRAECEETVAAAQAAFEEGKRAADSSPQASADAYRRSIALFRSLLDEGVVNGALYYNIGNAYLELGQIGEAILNYRRAETFLAGDGPLQANLRFARQLRANQIEASGERQFLRTAFFWHYTTTLRTRYQVAIVAYFFFWGCLFLRLVWRSPVWRWSAVAALVLWASAGASAGVSYWQQMHERAGVTVGGEIVVRKGSGEAYEPVFKERLHEGVEFIVRDERMGWYRIELPDGNTGWVAASAVRLLAEPDEPSPVEVDLRPVDELSGAG